MEAETLQAMIGRGLSQREMASVMDCSQSTIKYYLRKFKLKTQRAIHNRKSGYLCECGETDPKKFITRGNGRVCKSVCKTCHYKDRIERFRQKKLLAIEYKGGSCKICGYSKCPDALDFHHRDPSKKDPNWKHVRSWSFDKMKVELDKCDLLCVRCHREIHWESNKGL